MDLLETLLLPPGAVLVLLVAGLLAGGLGRRRLAMLLVALGTATLWTLSTSALSEPIVSRLERLHPPTPIEALPPADAILVLGGGIAAARPPRLGVELDDGADRLLHAARLYRAGRAPLVVVSGGNPRGTDDEPEAEGMAAILAEWGVPEEAILRETESRDTHQNCRNSLELLRERGLGRVLLVTSALHMPRALATCRTLGIEAVPASTDVRVVLGEAPPMALGPDAGVLARSALALHELGGIAVYAARGWLALEVLGGAEQGAAPSVAR